MRNRSALVFALLAVLLLPAVAPASDHADPIVLGTVEAGITGLFAFPKGDDLVVALTVRRGLTSGAPYDVEDFEYTIYMDFDPDVSFENEEDLARYGGTVNKPEAIQHDAAIRFRLDGDKTVVSQTGYPRFEGLADTSAIQVYTGVRDDPFIFPRFFGKNVIAMVLSIPMSSFPAGTQTWLMWGTTTREGWFGTKQIDHVGRSARSQAGRFDFLNRIEPKDQVAAIEKRLAGGQKLQKGITHAMGHLQPLAAMGDLFAYVLQIRPYDDHPDVLIFTTIRKPGYPNGRRLEDDVVGLTCAVGDCVLQEVASFETYKYHLKPTWPRPTKTDKAFLPDFPYLATPWPEQPEERHVDRCALVFWLIVLILLALWIFVCLRRAAVSEVPVVREYHPRLTDR